MSLKKTSHPAHPNFHKRSDIFLEGVHGMNGANSGEISVEMILKDEPISNKCLIMLCSLMFNDTFDKII